MATENSESKFGFKDKSKALETIELLKSEDEKYQTLTVRGLLGRAKRVLTLTKAEDKIKNITEAIQVFEQWIENNKNDDSKNTKSEKADTVPGLGFKDKAAAEQTLKILKDRDPNYQLLAVKGLLGNAKRVLASTKNVEKVKSIKEGMVILEQFVKDFEAEERSKQNMPYLDVDVMKNFAPTDKLAKAFLRAYEQEAKCNYKCLRTIHPEGNEKTWDIVRNKQLKSLKKEGVELFNEDGSPSSYHLDLIQWAYSPKTDKLLAYVKTTEKRKSAKRSAEDSDEESRKKKNKV